MRIRAKKSIIVVVAMTACLIIACALCLAGCNSGKSIVKETYDSYDNLASGANYYNADNEQVKKFSLKGTDPWNGYITVDLKEVKSFNTIVLKEKGKKVTLFSIYAGNENGTDYNLIYQSDTVEDGKVCYVGDINYRYLRIMVACADGKFELTDIGIYNIAKKDADLRVNAYVVAKSLSENSNLSMLNGVTDVIFFGTATFTENGDIVFLDDAGNDIGEAFYAEKLAILKGAIGDKDIGISVDIHLPYGDNNAKIDKLMGENKDKTVANLMTFLNKYGFDGYDVDYEYPANQSQWKVFNNFLRAVDEALGNKTLSIATSGWANNIDKDVVKMIDRVELMLYDHFDKHGYHSSFADTMRDINKLTSIGFDRKQIDIGVPFYSRPINGYAFWGDYSEYHKQLGKYNNLVNDNRYDHGNMPLNSPQYFNSYQMIADKTAFAIDAGLGGMMIWHMTCDVSFDNELSLTRAMFETKNAKLA